MRTPEARARIALVALKGLAELEARDCAALEFLRTLSEPATRELIQRYHGEGHGYPTLEVLAEIRGRLSGAAGLGC